MSPRDIAWQERAACRDEDPELFFPIGTLGPAAEQIERAKAVCRGCPVIEQCLAYALDTGQEYGIWGGLTADERRAVLRRRQRSVRIDRSAKELTRLLRSPAGSASTRG